MHEKFQQYRLDMIEAQKNLKFSKGKIAICFSNNSLLEKAHGHAFETWEHFSLMPHISCFR